jgi:hypothetical protein
MFEERRTDRPKPLDLAALHRSGIARGRAMHAARRRGDKSAAELLQADDDDGVDHLSA